MAASCAVCGAALPDAAAVGRRRRYCSATCRSAARRRRNTVPLTAGHCRLVIAGRSCDRPATVTVTAGEQTLDVCAVCVLPVKSFLLSVGADVTFAPCSPPPAARPVRGRLLVVEDDPDIALSLRLLFGRAGYHVTHAADGRSGLAEAFSGRPDLLVLDVGLPQMNGWQVLEHLRDVSDMPVLILTAHAREAEKVRGLRGGADAYLIKPWDGNELLARVEALLRRSAQPLPPAFDDGLLRLDPVTRRVVVDGVHRHLTATEFRLLDTLVRNAGAVLSPNQLLARAWDDPTGVAPDRVRFAVQRLRRKLGWSGPAPSPIEAVRGFGFRYRPPEPQPVADEPAHALRILETLRIMDTTMGR